jgi:hypothetical protein
MDAQLDEKALEKSLAESLGDLVPDERTVSEDEFVEIVRQALELVGGEMLFKMCIDVDGRSEFVAAATVGSDAKRQFLLLTLPVHGGALKVETASKNTNPVAGIAPAYAGLMDVFQAAA